MKRQGFTWMAAMLVATAAPLAARGQSPEPLLQRVAAHADARTQGVENYAVELSGLETRITLYTSRRTPSSPFDVQFAGAGTLGQSATDVAWAETFVLMLQDERVRSRTPARLSYGGVADVEGTPAHVVTVTLRGRRSEDGSVPRSLTVAYDTTTLVPLRVEWVTELPDGGTIRNAVEYADYRIVEGVPIAFRRRAVVRGVRGNLSEAQLARLRQSVVQLRAELPRVPEADQARVRQTIEMAEGVLERDEQITELTVTSAVVNQGLPNGVPLRRLAPLIP
jgi:hypothetical protein